MKKIRLYIFSFLFLLLFVLSQSTSFMEWWADYRVQKLHAPYTRVRYGDIYSSCFLPQFMDTTHKKLREYKTTKTNIDLYMLHDSYLGGQIKKENFIGVDKLILSDFRGEGVCACLNRKKKNILIIECSERMADWRLTDTSLSYPKLYTKRTKTLKNIPRQKKEKSLLKIFFNPFINQNLEFILFDYEFFKLLKETKAKTNFKTFDKLPADIAVSSDKKYLLLNETIDLQRFESSFRWLSNPDIDNIVYLINLTEIHYKNLGFDEVYFSIIPNPVSIIDTERYLYNYKISRIKNTIWLNAKFIDVFDIFKKSKKRVYRRDDSHWNNYGLQLWVDQVNSKLLSY